MHDEVAVLMNPDTQETLTESLAMDAAQATADKAADDQAWEEKKLRQEKRWLARQAHYFRTGCSEWHKQ
jgi:hypothetical protein